jgi:hypothetical protein
MGRGSRDWDGMGTHAARRRNDRRLAYPLSRLLAPLLRVGGAMTGLAF